MAVQGWWEAQASLGPVNLHKATSMGIPHFVVAIFVNLDFPLLFSNFLAGDMPQNGAKV